MQCTMPKTSVITIMQHVGSLICFGEENIGEESDFVQIESPVCELKRAYVPSSVQTTISVAKTKGLAYMLLVPTLVLHTKFPVYKFKYILHKICLSF